MSISAEITNVKERGPNKEVTVEITAPKMTPQMLKEASARAHALVAVGLINTVEDLVREATEMDPERVTDVVCHKTKKEIKYNRVISEIKVVVRNA